MNTANSFKKMLEEDELRFPLPPEIEENVFGSLKILAIMGQAMELYIPKVLEMFILTLGGTIKEINNPSTSKPSPGNPGGDSGHQPPGMSGSGHEIMP